MERCTSAYTEKQPIQTPIKILKVTIQWLRREQLPKLYTTEPSIYAAIKMLLSKFQQCKKVLSRTISLLIYVSI